MLLCDIKKKGNFFFTESARQDCGYDIYFVADGEMEMKYISTVPDFWEAKKHCEIYKQMHDTGVEEYKKDKEINAILIQIVDAVYRKDEFRWLDADFDSFAFVKPYFEEKKEAIEKIKGRPLTEEEEKDYITRVCEWYC